MELAFDLASLALYDIVIYADDSTSMQYAEGQQLPLCTHHFTCLGILIQLHTMVTK